MQSAVLLYESEFKVCLSWGFSISINFKLQNEIQFKAMQNGIWFFGSWTSLWVG